MRGAAADRDPLAALVRLFVLGRPVRRGALSGALPTLGLDGADRLGLVQGGGRGVDDLVRPLHASRHSTAVVATDVSGPALAFAAFNAALAGVRLDLRRGSMLEPVAGEHVDLVVANPPFVITRAVPTTARSTSTATAVAPATTSSAT